MPVFRISQTQADAVSSATQLEPIGLSTPPTPPPPEAQSQGRLQPATESTTAAVEHPRAAPSRHSEAPAAERNPAPASPKPRRPPGQAIHLLRRNANAALTQADAVSSETRLDSIGLSTPPTPPPPEAQAQVRRPRAGIAAMFANRWERSIDNLQVSSSSSSAVALGHVDNALARSAHPDLHRAAAARRVDADSLPTPLTFTTRASTSANPSTGTPKLREQEGRRSPPRADCASEERPIDYDYPPREVARRRRLTRQVYHSLALPRPPRPTRPPSTPAFPPAIARTITPAARFPSVHEREGRLRRDRGGGRWGGRRRCAGMGIGRRFLQRPGADRAATSRAAFAPPIHGQARVQCVRAQEGRFAAELRRTLGRTSVPPLEGEDRMALVKNGPAQITPPARAQLVGRTPAPTSTPVSTGTHRFRPREYIASGGDREGGGRCQLCDAVQEWGSRWVVEKRGMRRGEYAARVGSSSNSPNSESGALFIIHSFRRAFETESLGRHTNDISMASLQFRSSTIRLKRLRRILRK
ncbi:hypothetical protein C8R47DRAFT_1067309 [Mycena vitilis]|nr:hypothetical protein C8R47DRAFT_1067309 [Mycena vitilis]